MYPDAIRNLEMRKSHEAEAEAEVGRWRSTVSSGTAVISTDASPETLAHQVSSLEAHFGLQNLGENCCYPLVKGAVLGGSRREAAAARGAGPWLPWAYIAKWDGSGLPAALHRMWWPQLPSPGDIHSSCSPTLRN